MDMSVVLGIHLILIPMMAIILQSLAKGTNIRKIFKKYILLKNLFIFSCGSLIFMTFLILLLWVYKEKNPTNVGF